MRLGWPFAFDWDRQALDRVAAAEDFCFDRPGFNLFSFPSNLALPFYDHQRFARRQAERGRRLGWRAVLSHHEQFGALAAALIAEQLGLPGAPPEAILAAQHKLHARRVLGRVAAEASLPFEELELDYGEPIPDGLRYPRFVKPVKAAFSVLARDVRSRAELQAHTRFDRREMWIIRQLVDPFDRVCRARLPEAGSAHRMLLEDPVPLHVSQFNLDGWVADGRVRTIGVVRAVMYPGTRAFMRWELPAGLDSAVEQRATDVARRFLSAIGYDRGFFNLEFFHDEASGRLTVIECNPRLASQFGDLYRRVLGIDPHRMAVALALDEDPERVPRVAPSASVAASLVYRAFSPGEVPAAPGRDARAAFAREFPDALLISFPKRGGALARDFKWTGNHHYGFVHLGARNHDELCRRARRASAIVGWPAPCQDLPLAEESLSGPLEMKKPGDLRALGI
jgi:hypothetical protein